MIPKLEFTADSWREEDKNDAAKIFSKYFNLNGNPDIRCWRENTNMPFAYVGCKNKKFLMDKYGYADSESAIEKYLKPFINDKNNEYFITLGLMSMDYEKYYKNGSYINEDGEDTGEDYWDIYDEDHLMGKREYENEWITFVIYKIV